ncbi:hypothetical protein FM106_12870 [Brachybacterium faecium]|nr:hypothetical protein FM106_12870 [Brachybacterium faecium]
MLKERETRFTFIQIEILKILLIRLKKLNCYRLVHVYTPILFSGLVIFL